MYLKEIRAQGFKSFADKINIELTKGITGIVGPNGSGKSNVVDAIRWVLGEQSVKSLRGDGNMTDVIFSGSKSRKESNSASVSLILDNSDRYLPVDYNEVEIKRRVYRDGTNEYYFNGERCRLKDITDILTDSGIAKESFNIISQGKIDEILLSKPVDRRVIFEEAAGVLKYKKRKEEALRKLQRTHDNMGRVADIINELETQIEPLKEQKNKALEYLELTEELKNIEVALIANDITNINYKYQNNKDRIDLLNKEILAIGTTNNTNESKIEEYKLLIYKIDEKIRLKQQQLIELTTKVEKINTQKQLIIERQKFQVEDTKLHNNLIELKENEHRFKNDIYLLESEIIKLTKENEIISNNIKEHEKNLNKLKENRNKLEIEISNLSRNELFLKNKIESLKNSIDNNASVPFSVKSILDNPKLRGIHNVIGKLIETSEEYSIAISTALGASSTNIVVDNENCAKDAINYLKNNNLGRVTFYPINIIKGKYIDKDILQNIKKIDGFIDIASNVTSFDSKYKDIITNLLGSVIIAKNIDSANIIGKIINYRYKIVTLDGELLQVGGSVTGGSISKSKNIIVEKYELEKLLKELEKININIKNIENKINELDHGYRSCEDKIYLLSKTKITNNEYINTKNQLVREYNDKLNLISHEINSTNNILSNTISKEEEIIINEYYQTLKEKDQKTSDYEELLKEKNNLSETLEEFEFSLKKENQEFNSKNRELKELEIEVNRLDVKLDNLLNNLNETYNMTYESAIAHYKLEIDENIARNNVYNIKRKLREIGPVNVLAPEEYDKVSTRYDFLLKQRDDLVNAENVLLEIIKEMDQVMEKEFIKTFKIIKENFVTTFKDLFKGGTADLKLTDPDNLLETGVEIVASPPGKKLTSISLLSGGEKTFTAISLLFAIIKTRPAPFCVLDEVEAALDEVNVDSFGKYIVNLKSMSQFILITHKKKTMEYVDALYGITMQESGVSKLVSVKLEDIK
ncbi:MAG TPA: AAA family ATPase [Tenericutes bacterium]|nr:AAA family ATPase [Mycoplasmatota bacterium]